MRNVHDNGAAEAPQPDDGTNAVYSSAASRSSRRRRQTMIGAVGLLSILGMGVFVADQMTDRRDTAPASRADGPVGDAPVASTPGATTGSSPAPRPAAKPAAAPTTAPLPKTDAERITAARSASAKATARVLRPLPDAGVAAVNEADVTTAMVKRDGETLKIMSARQDLTGYRELAWIVDRGRKVGNARCTSKIRLSTGVKARERPTLLLCWRTSPTKSVYTLAVKADGRPSATASTTAIDRQWVKLG